MIHSHVHHQNASSTVLKEENVWPCSYGHRQPPIKLIILFSRRDGRTRTCDGFRSPMFPKHVCYQLHHIPYSTLGGVRFPSLMIRNQVCYPITPRRYLVHLKGLEPTFSSNYSSLVSRTREIQVHYIKEHQSG